MTDRREQLRQWYGLDFPDDLIAVWELARTLQPGKPTQAFEATTLCPTGVFDVLAGKFDAQPPDGPLWTHGMSYNDPPEFFTIFWGDCDGYHLGWWFDDPMRPPTCVASYYNNDAYDLGRWPADLFLMLRRQVEYSVEGVLDNRRYDAANADYYDGRMEDLDELREALRPHLPGAAKRRRQTGTDYLRRYTRQDVDDSGIVAQTWGRECIRAPAHLYVAPPADNETIWREAREPAGAARWLREAERALRDGLPATALKLGKDVRHLCPKEAEADTCAVMCAAYQALGRPLLAEVLRARQAQRDAWDAERAEREARKKK
jgi:hypothetical protein